MSTRESWKMLHLLYTLQPGTPGLSAHELAEAGVDCGPDAILPLVDGEAAVFENGFYSLTKAARTIVRTCIVANRRWPGRDMWVDYPEVFIIMPFSEPWSDDVYEKMIQPAAEGASLLCTRGDTPPRVGDLTQTIWDALMKAGLIVADVSVVNANVFYEIGLAHALGKDTFILKQEDADIPADFGGSHYYEYKVNQLSAGRSMLQREFTEWAWEKGVEGVRRIKDS